MYPNEKFLKFFSRELLPFEKEGQYRSGCLHVGAFFVIRKIISDYQLDEMIARIIGQDAGYIDLSVIPAECQHNAHMFYIKLADLETRNRFIAHMKEKEIGVAFHYVPLHSSAAGKNMDIFREKTAIRQGRASAW